MNIIKDSSDVKESHRLKIKRSFIGVTLIEITIGLAIAAVVVAIAYRGYEQNASRNQVIEDSRLIAEMMSDIINNFGPSSKFGDLSTAIVITSGTIPSRYIDRTTNPPTARNQYGGEIFVAPVGVSDTFAYIRYEKVPKRNCMGLVMLIAPSAQGLAVRPSVDNSPPVAAADWNIKLFDTSSTVDLNELNTVCRNSSITDVNVTVGFSKS